MRFDNIAFQAKVLKISSNTLLVETIDSKAFDKASVGLSKNIKIADKSQKEIPFEEI